MQFVSSLAVYTRGICHQIYARCVRVHNNRLTVIKIHFAWIEEGIIIAIVNYFVYLYFYIQSPYAGCCWYYVFIHMYLYYHVLWIGIQSKLKIHDNSIRICSEQTGYNNKPRRPLLDAIVQLKECQFRMLWVIFRKWEMNLEPMLWR